jgi:uncharacterized protein (DUF433 family)
MAILNQILTIDKEVASDVPVFRGTRVAIRTLFDYLKDSSLEEFLEGFPSVSRELAASAIELAAAKFLSEISK